MKIALVLLPLLAMALFLRPPLARSAPNEERGTPVPKISAAQAIEKVAKYYQDHEPEPGAFIVSVVYGRPDKLHLTIQDHLMNIFVMDGESEWSWFVTFSRPHEFEPIRIFRLRDNGTVTPLVEINT